MVTVAAVILLLAISASAFPHDPIIRKLDDGLRYQYMQGDDGELHLVDLWVKASDLEEAARFDPDRTIVYHLFTRQNPTISQPILFGNTHLQSTNFNPNRRTILISHGWMGSPASDVNTVLVPAFLSVEDVNILVLDWSSGAGTINYATAVINTITSAESIARFIAWLNASMGHHTGMYHLLGHSLGGHQVGIIGRNLGGVIAYITALEPAFPGWITNDNRFRPNDGIYTEVIHTNAGILGYMATLGQADFYPNGGINMPGCNSQECDHARCYHYMAESIVSGGFTGTRCSTYASAMTGYCFLWGSLQMGGIRPKNGSSGIFYLETNAAPPFSRG